jgi:hypothetical protein
VGGGRGQVSVGQGLGARAVMTTVEDGIVTGEVRRVMVVWWVL